VPTITALRQHYGQQVRFVWKDNPLSFHKQARPAAMLAHEAFAQRGRDGFWRAHDHLFETQRNLEDNDLLRYAGQLGLDVAAAQLAVSSQKHQRIVRKSQRLASRLGATGAPTSFVNGRLLKGARPVDAFKKLIDEELRKAKTLVADGTRKSELYAKIIRDGTRRERLDRRFVAGVSDAPFLGAENAPVVIHEFSDFQCPFCSRVNPTLKTVLAEYGNRVKLVWRHKPLPFHKNAPLAHQAALEAFAQKGNDGFWTMHDKLFENQRALQRLDLEGYALSTGLDITRFRAALDDGRHQARIDRDLAAADAANIKGTPSFVINGEFISGAQPIAKFRTVIDRALAAAQ